MDDSPALRKGRISRRAAKRAAALAAERRLAGERDGEILIGVFSGSEDLEGHSTMTLREPSGAELQEVHHQAPARSPQSERAVQGSSGTSGAQSHRERDVPTAAPVSEPGNVESYRPLSPRERAQEHALFNIQMQRVIRGAPPIPKVVPGSDFVALADQASSAASQLADSAATSIRYESTYGNNSVAQARERQRAREAKRAAAAAMDGSPPPPSWDTRHRIAEAQLRRADAVERIGDSLRIAHRVWNPELDPAAMSR